MRTLLIGWCALVVASSVAVGKVSAAATSAVEAQEETMSLNEHLAVFKPFVGKTWRGEFADSTPEKPKFDVSRWERALNGQAVRVMHSVNDGEYGGETIIMWDREKNRVVFYYFTTAGFYTTGEFTQEDGKFVSHEKVTGNEGGITEVRAVGELLPDGRLRSSSEYLHQGKWVKGHEIVYVEAPEAAVKFK